MANTVYDVQVVTLQDGKDVEVRSLPIKKLRIANRILGSLSEDLTEEQVAAGLTDDDVSLDKLISLAALAISKQRPEVWNSSTQTATEEAEELFDMPTVFRVIKVATGVELNNPKILEIAQEMAGSPGNN